MEETAPTGETVTPKSGESGSRKMAAVLVEDVADMAAVLVKDVVAMLVEEVANTVAVLVEEVADMVAVLFEEVADIMAGVVRMTGGCVVSDCSDLCCETTAERGVTYTLLRVLELSDAVGHETVFAAAVIELRVAVEQTELIEQ